MKSSPRVGSTLFLALCLLIVGGVAALWWSAFSAKSEFFGPGCAAEFNC